MCRGVPAPRPPGPLPLSALLKRLPARPARPGHGAHGGDRDLRGHRPARPPPHPGVARLRRRLHLPPQRRADRHLPQIGHHLDAGDPDAALQPRRRPAGQDHSQLGEGAVAGADLLPGGSAGHGRPAAPHHAPARARAGPRPAAQQGQGDLRGQEPQRRRRLLLPLPPPGQVPARPQLLRCLPDAVPRGHSALRLLVRARQGLAGPAAPPGHPLCHLRGAAPGPAGHRAAPQHLPGVPAGTGHAGSPGAALQLLGHAGQRHGQLLPDPRRDHGPQPGPLHAQGGGGGLAQPLLPRAERALQPALPGGDGGHGAAHTVAHGLRQPPGFGGTLSPHLLTTTRRPCRAPPKPPCVTPRGRGSGSTVPPPPWVQGAFPALHCGRPRAPAAPARGCGRDPSFRPSHPAEINIYCCSLRGNDSHGSGAGSAAVIRNSCRYQEHIGVGTHPRGPH